VHCKAHDLDNLYVVDGGFMPSVGAVNPVLTIIANALQVGDHIAERIGAACHRLPGAVCGPASPTPPAP
jgi:choline dehydrogenase-like flavoprotein